MKISKTIYRLSLLIVLLLFSVQYNSSAQENKKPKKETKKKRNTKMETIDIIPFKSDYTVKVGQKLKYVAEDHASVGISSGYVLENEKIVSFKTQEIKYDKPKSESEPGTTGGDKAAVTYFFEAKAKGVCKLTLRHYFRGDVENEYNITITVE